MLRIAEPAQRGSALRRDEQSFQAKRLYAQRIAPHATRFAYTCVKTKPSAPLTQGAGRSLSSTRAWSHWHACYARCAESRGALWGSLCPSCVCAPPWPAHGVI